MSSLYKFQSVLAVEPDRRLLGAVSRAAALHFVGRLRDRSFKVHAMWNTPLLSRLRQSFLKGRAAASSVAKRSEQHFGPMSDRQLAAAIRQFQRPPLVNDRPLSSATGPSDK